MCSSDLDNRRATQEEEGLAPGALFESAEALLGAIKPDCLIVATTAPSHAPLTILAAEAGVRAILCEKPMATSLAECDAMLAACARYGAKLAINHQMRFMEQYTEARRLLESPALGGWRSVNVIAGNFGLAMNGTHYFELVRWLAGEPLSEVSATFSREIVPNPRGPEFHDRAGCVRALLPSGRRLFLDASADQGHGVTVVYAARNGVLVAEELDGRILVTARKAEHREQPTTRYGMPTDKETLAVAPADAVVPSQRVLEALLEGRDYPTGEDGRAAVATLVAVYVSAESDGRLVKVDDRLPRERRFDYA